MKAAIVLNSQAPIADIKEDVIIAADRGYILALEQNKTPTIVIGDFDSSNIPENLKIIKLNVEKDNTDGEACIDWAKDNGFNEITIYGITSGRIDHQLANISLLAYGDKLGLRVVGEDRDCRILYLKKGKYSFDMDINQEFSIFPFDGTAIIDNGIGCKYPINNLKLLSYLGGRAISNKALNNNKVSFDVIDGSVLLIINK